MKCKIGTLSLAPSPIILLCLFFPSSNNVKRTFQLVLQLQRPARDGGYLNAILGLQNRELPISAKTVHAKCNFCRERMVVGRSVKRQFAIDIHPVKVLSLAGCADGVAFKDKLRVLRRLQ